MAVKKIEIRPKGTGDYADVLYPMTSDDMVQVADANNHFTATKLNGVLDELFTFANDGKTAVANAVTAKGVTASPTDTFSTLATKIGQINSSNIKSIQTGLASITGSAVSTNVTITAVDTTKSVVKITLTTANGTQARDFLVSGFLVNGTTLQLNRGIGRQFDVTVRWEVIEFTGVKTVQSGVQSAPSTAAVNVTLGTTVNLAKSIIFCSSNTDANDAAADYLNLIVQAEITNTNTIKLVRGGGGVKTFYWWVVEFN